jgi:transposase
MFTDPKFPDLTAFPEELRGIVTRLMSERDSAVSDAAALQSDKSKMTDDVARLSTQNAELSAVNARLEHMVRELNQLVYGKRSEKLTQDERQLAFEDLEIAVAEAQAQSDAVEMTTPRKKRKPPQRNLGNLPEHLDRIEVVIEPDSITCPCGCGEMVKIGEDRTERLDIIPATARVIVTIRPKYACPNKKGGILQAPAPVHPIEGGLPTQGHARACGDIEVWRPLPALPAKSDIRPFWPGLAKIDPGGSPGASSG